MLLPLLLMPLLLSVLADGVLAAVASSSISPLTTISVPVSASIRLLDCFSMLWLAHWYQLGWVFAHTHIHFTLFLRCPLLPLRFPDFLLLTVSVFRFATNRQREVAFFRFFPKLYSAVSHSLSYDTYHCTQGTGVHKSVPVCLSECICAGFPSLSLSHFLLSCLHRLPVSHSYRRCSPCKSLLLHALVYSPEQQQQSFAPIISSHLLTSYPSSFPFSE